MKRANFLFIFSIVFLLSCGDEMELYEWATSTIAPISTENNEPLPESRIISHKDLGFLTYLVVKQGYGTATSSLFFPASKDVQTSSKIRSLNITYEYTYFSDTLVDTLFVIDTILCIQDNTPPNELVCHSSIHDSSFNSLVEAGVDGTFVFDTLCSYVKYEPNIAVLDSVINDNFVCAKTSTPNDTLSIPDFIALFGSPQNGTIDSTFYIYMKSRPMYTIATQEDSVKFNFKIDLNLYSTSANWETFVFDTIRLVEPDWDYNPDADTITRDYIYYDTLFCR